MAKIEAFNRVVEEIEKRTRKDAPLGAPLSFVIQVPELLTIRDVLEVPGADCTFCEHIEGQMVTTPVIARILVECSPSRVELYCWCSDCASAQDSDEAFEAERRRFNRWHVSYRGFRPPREEESEAGCEILLF